MKNKSLPMYVARMVSSFRDLNLKASFNYITSLALLIVFFTSCQKHDVLDTLTPSNVNGTSQAVINPVTNGVMMQGFYWDVPVNTSGIGTWWQVLQSKAVELKTAGITAMWIPPAYKGGSATDVGYGVYDRYDLGEFTQKGFLATRYGTIGQLQSAITALHGQNIAVYEDIVMNHLVFADAQETRNNQQVWTAFNYTGRNNTYSSYKWNASLMNGWQGGSGWVQWNSWDFAPYNNNDAYDNLLGCEIKYNPETGSGALETINWGNWITTKLNLDGYRLDATKHIYTPFVNKWLNDVTGTKFKVSEAWMNNVSQLNAYVAATNGKTSLFDVPLHYMFNEMSNQNGGYNMANFAFAGFTEANGPLSVSFVDNHDTDHPGPLFSPVSNLKMLAYAYILTRSGGYPCVFYKDYYEYGLGNQIKKIIECRKSNGYGTGFEYTSVNDQDVYVYSRSGDGAHAGMLVMLNDGSTARTKTVTTPFKNATLTDKTGNTAGTVTTNAAGTGTFSVNSRNYAIWVPNGTPVNAAPVISISPAAGAVMSGTVVTLSATDDSGIAPTIFYTTDGSTPTTSSPNPATGSKTFTINSATTIRAIARDGAGLVTSVSVFPYTIANNTTNTDVTFNINYSNTVQGQDVYICGSTAQLGAWNTANAIKLSGVAWPTWRGTISLTSGTSVQYKYFRRTGTDAKSIVWEAGANRTFTPSGATQTRTDTWQ